MCVFCLFSRAFTCLLLINETCSTLWLDKGARLKGMLCVLTYFRTSSLLKAGMPEMVGVIAGVPTGRGLAVGRGNFPDLPWFDGPQPMSMSAIKMPIQKTSAVLYIGETLPTFCEQSTAIRR